MRQYLVLGYPSNSTKDHGECLYLGSDRGEAMAMVNTAGEQARRELYDLAAPQVRRHMPAVKNDGIDADLDPDTKKNGKDK